MYINCCLDTKCVARRTFLWVLTTHLGLCNRSLLNPILDVHCCNVDSCWVLLNGRKTFSMAQIYLSKEPNTAWGYTHLAPRIVEECRAGFLQGSIATNELETKRRCCKLTICPFAVCLQGCGYHDGPLHRRWYPWDTRVDHAQLPCACRNRTYLPGAFPMIFVGFAAH